MFLDTMRLHAFLLSTIAILAVTGAQKVTHARCGRMMHASVAITCLDSTNHMS